MMELEPIPAVIGWREGQGLPGQAAILSQDVKMQIL